MQEKFMKLAIKEALKSREIDEVPIGAIIVRDGKVIARAHNLIEKDKCAVSHAEILAIKKASKKVGDWRLIDCDMFVTVEPCSMCAGAIANARIRKVYFGAYNEKSGCAESLYPILTDNGLNAKVEFFGGILEKECKDLIIDYFRKKRALKP